MANRVAGWLGVGPVIAASCAVLGVGGLLAGLATGSTGAVLTVLIVAYFLWGSAFTVYNVVAGSLRQIITPERMRGRVMSTASAAISGINPAGAILGGALGAWLGPRTAVIVAGALMLVSVGWIVPSPVIRLRIIPETADAAQTADATRAGMERRTARPPPRSCCAGTCSEAARPSQSPSGPSGSRKTAEEVP
jgi:MFS family permease